MTVHQSGRERESRTWAIIINFHPAEIVVFFFFKFLFDFYFIFGFLNKKFFSQLNCSFTHFHQEFFFDFFSVREKIEKKNTHPKKKLIKLISFFFPEWKKTDEVWEGGRGRGRCLENFSRCLT
jgi:hypothetical protein